MRSGHRTSSKRTSPSTSPWRKRSLTWSEADKLNVTLQRGAVIMEDKVTSTCTHAPKSRRPLNPRHVPRVVGDMGAAVGTPVEHVSVRDGYARRRSGFLLQGEERSHPSPGEGCNATVRRFRSSNRNVDGRPSGGLCALRSRSPRRGPKLVGLRISIGNAHCLSPDSGPRSLNSTPRCRPPRRCGGSSYERGWRLGATHVRTEATP